ncbi:MAG: hypothetical protein J6D15_05725 [Clostridia bacterium]|nr:hypothetical protein [Clostridia bacterium]
MLENGVVTVFSQKTKGGDFVKIACCPAWIYKKERLRNKADGVYLRDSFDVRIGLSHLENVSVGDLIFFGEIEESDFFAGKCRRIATITKNEKGTFPHWHLWAEYEYR